MNDPVPMDVRAHDKIADKYRRENLVTIARGIVEQAKERKKEGHDYITQGRTTEGEHALDWALALLNQDGTAVMYFAADANDAANMKRRMEETLRELNTKGR
jgi:hypothetical protein